MNYLGHIYFSGSDPLTIQANLFGDFVKGSNLSRFPIQVEKGIRLHRSIDHFIDHHPAVIELLQVIRPQLPKIAPIAIDIYFDHLLAKHWLNFNSTSLTDFLDRLYESIAVVPELFGSEFAQFIQQLILKNWISVYSTLYGLDKMCNGVGKKISFENQLHLGQSVFLAHEKSIETAFFEYMHDANEHFLAKL